MSSLDVDIDHPSPSPASAPLATFSSSPSSSLPLLHLRSLLSSYFSLHSLLKQWESSFTLQYGHSPSPSDLRNNVRMRERSREMNEIKGKIKIIKEREKAMLMRKEKKKKEKISRRADGNDKDNDKISDDDENENDDEAEYERLKKGIVVDGDNEEAEKENVPNIKRVKIKLSKPKVKTNEISMDIDDLDDTMGFMPKVHQMEIIPLSSNSNPKITTITMDKNLNPILMNRNSLSSIPSFPSQTNIISSSSPSAVPLPLPLPPSSSSSSFSPFSFPSVSPSLPSNFHQFPHLSQFSKTSEPIPSVQIPSKIKTHALPLPLPSSSSVASPSSSSFLTPSSTPLSNDEIDVEDKDDDFSFPLAPKSSITHTSIPSRSEDMEMEMVLNSEEEDDEVDAEEEGEEGVEGEEGGEVEEGHSDTNDDEEEQSESVDEVEWIRNNDEDARITTLAVAKEKSNKNKNKNDFTETNQKEFTDPTLTKKRKRSKKVIDNFISPSPNLPSSSSSPSSTSSHSPSASPPPRRRASSSKVSLVSQNFVRYDLKRKFHSKKRKNSSSSFTLNSKKARWKNIAKYKMQKEEWKRQQSDKMYCDALDEKELKEMIICQEEEGGVGGVRNGEGEGQRNNSTGNVMDKEEKKRDDEEFLAEEIRNRMGNNNFIPMKSIQINDSSVTKSSSLSLPSSSYSSPFGPLSSPSSSSPPIPFSDAHLHSVLHQTFGFSTFRSGQLSAIRTVLSSPSSSTLLILPTGWGKSLVYQMISLLIGGVSLIITPLISLMEDQIRSLPNGIKGFCWTSQHTPEEIFTMMESIRNHSLTTPHLLFLSPEKILSPSFVRFISSLPNDLIRFICIDEAHCISSWSHNFRPAYRRIFHFIRKGEGNGEGETERGKEKEKSEESNNVTNPNAMSDEPDQFGYRESDLTAWIPSITSAPPLSLPSQSSSSCDLPSLFPSLSSIRLLGLTATSTASTTSTIASTMGVKSSDIITVKNDRRNLHVEVSLVHTDMEKRKKLLQLLLREEQIEKEGLSDEHYTPSPLSHCKSIIIYCAYQKSTESLVEFLQRHHISSLHYHSGIPSDKRRLIATKFFTQKIRVLVATVAFGLGINNLNVDGIIHYHLPHSVEQFVQEIGRAGRKQNVLSYCHLLYCPSDSAFSMNLIHGGLVEAQYIHKFLYIVWAKAKEEREWVRQLKQKFNRNKSKNHDKNNTKENDNHDDNDNENDNNPTPSPSPLTDWNPYIPIELLTLENEFDMSSEVCQTLLTELESLGYIHFHSTLHYNVKIGFHRHHPTDLAQHVDFIHSLMYLHQQGEAKLHNGLYEFSLLRLSAIMSIEVNDLLRDLLRLKGLREISIQWEKQAFIIQIARKHFILHDDEEERKRLGEKLDTVRMKHFNNSVRKLKIMEGVARYVVGEQNVRRMEEKEKMDREVREMEMKGGEAEGEGRKSEKDNYIDKGRRKGKEVKKGVNSTKNQNSLITASPPPSEHTNPLSLLRHHLSPASLPTPSSSKYRPPHLPPFSIHSLIDDYFHYDEENKFFHDILKGLGDVEGEWEEEKQEGNNGENKGNGDGNTDMTTSSSSSSSSSPSSSSFYLSPQRSSLLSDLVVSLLTTTGITFRTSRDITRILFGMSSPLYDIKTWGNTRYWGEFRDLPFNGMKAKVEEIWKDVMKMRREMNTQKGKGKGVGKEKEKEIEPEGQKPNKNKKRKLQKSPASLRHHTENEKEKSFSAVKELQKYNERKLTVSDDEEEEEEEKYIAPLSADIIENSADEDQNENNPFAEGLHHAQTCNNADAAGDENGDESDGDSEQSKEW